MNGPMNAETICQDKQTNSNRQSHIKKIVAYNNLFFSHFTDSGSVCINVGDVEDDILDGSVTFHPEDHKKGVFLAGLKVTATIIDVERAPRAHPFNPNL